MGKTLLITGCSGQLGHRLNSDLSNYFNVIDTYREHQDANKKLDLLEKSDFDRIFSNYNPDIIINCAALTDVDYCENNRHHCHSVNVEGLKRLISFSGSGTKIIHISTDYVFNGTKGFYSEGEATHPINYYGKCKLESENILIGSNRDYIIFRASMLFDNDKKNFFTWVLNNLKSGNEIKVATDIESNPAWIPAFSNIIMKSIYLNLSGLFHYGTDKSISRFDFAVLIAKAFNYNEDLIVPIKLNDLNFSAERPRKTDLVPAKLSKQLEVDVESLDYILKIVSAEL